MRLLGRLGVKLEGRRLLDIGCGTGVYALTLAGTVESVLGVDSSAAMLKVFRKARKERRIANAGCLLSEWGGVPAAEVRGKFDVALASMTAAVKTRSDVLKMEAAAAEACVYIGWAGERRNALLEKVYSAHGVPYRAPEGAARTLRLLRALGRRPRTVYLRESWTKEATPEETLREIGVSMRVNGAALRREWTGALLRARARNGKVRQRTSARKAVIVWKPPLRKGRRRGR